MLPHFFGGGGVVTQQRTGGTANKIFQMVGLAHDLESRVEEGFNTGGERPAGDQDPRPA